MEISSSTAMPYINKNTNLDEKLVKAYDTKDDEKLKETCQEFESMFVNLMLKEMRKTIPESDFMPQSFATQTFEEMYDEEIAKSVSKGKGIGIADAMYRQMSYQLSKQYKVEE